jgi:hypothetical protein
VVVLWSFWCHSHAVVGALQEVKEVSQRDQTSGSQSQKGAPQWQPITEETTAVAANRRQDLNQHSGSQSQNGPERWQLITY